MYEADESLANGLEAETLRRMRDVFEGRVCATCGTAAARLCADEFFCHGHYPEAWKTGRSPRVYRCQAAVEK